MQLALLSNKGNSPATRKLLQGAALEKSFTSLDRFQREKRHLRVENEYAKDCSQQSVVFAGRRRFSRRRGRPTRGGDRNANDRISRRFP
jgi:hypothetical protein